MLLLLQFEELKTDFQYNLKLLSERDAELDSYDVAYAGSMSTISEKESLMAELQTLVTSVQAGTCPQAGRQVCARSPCIACYSSCSWHPWQYMSSYSAAAAAWIKVGQAVT